LYYSSKEGWEISLPFLMQMIDILSFKEYNYLYFTDNKKTFNQGTVPWFSKYFTNKRISKIASQINKNYKSIRNPKKFFKVLYRAVTA